MRAAILPFLALQVGCGSFVRNDPLLGDYYDECVEREEALWPKGMRDDERIDRQCRETARNQGAPQKKAERQEAAREVVSAIATGLSAASCGVAEGAERVACEQRQTRLQMQRDQARAEQAFREEMEANRAQAAEMHDEDLRAMAAEEEGRAQQLAAHRAEIEGMFADAAADRPAWSCWYGLAAGRGISMCFPSAAQCAQSFVDVAAGGLAMHGDRCLAQESVVCVDAADGKVVTSVCAATAVHCETVRADLSANGWAVGQCLPS